MNLVVKWSLTFWGLIICRVLCSVAQSCLTLCDSMDCNPPGFYVHGYSPGRNTGVGCHSLLQGIFPTQGSYPGPALQADYLPTELPSSLRLGQMIQGISSRSVGGHWAPPKLHDLIQHQARSFPISTWYLGPDSFSLFSFHPLSSLQFQEK